MTESEAKRRTRRWLEDAVIGLNFCPFARPVFVQDQVRIAVQEDVGGLEAAVERAFDEVNHLLDHPDTEVATTLIVYPEALADFGDYLDVVETLRYALEDSGLEGVLQVATFHPDYQFAGTAPDDLENYTNRSPYPTIHLIREAQVTDAVESHPDPEGIPRRNIERLEEMGRERVEQMWSVWMPE